VFAGKESKRNAKPKNGAWKKLKKEEMAAKK